jgi:hypothetical protein
MKLNLKFFLFVFSISQFAMATESYIALDAAVKACQSRVEDKQKRIRELGEEKAGVKDEAKVKEILDEMISEAKEMKDFFVKFQKQKKRLQYEFPSKGDETERKYKRFEVDTIEQLNSLSNTDLRLKGLLSRVEHVYQKPPEKIAKEQREEDERRRNSTTLHSDEKKNPEQDKVLEERPKLSY